MVWLPGDGWDEEDLARTAGSPLLIRSMLTNRL